MDALKGNGLVSSVCPVLSLGVPVLKRLTEFADQGTLMKRCVSIMEILQSLIGFNYWRPESYVDGTGSTEFVTGQFRTEDLCKVKKKAELYA